MPPALASTLGGDSRTRRMMRPTINDAAGLRAAPVLALLLILLSAAVAVAQSVEPTLEVLGHRRQGEGQTATLMARLDPLPVANTAALGASTNLPWAEVPVYEWDFGDGSPKVSGWNAMTVQHRYREQGSYLVTVRARTSQGVVAEGRHTIEIMGDTDSALHEEVVWRIYHRPAPEKERTITFDAGFLSLLDYHGDTFRTTWSFGDGTTVEGFDQWTVSHTFPRGGFYDVVLDIEDFEGATDTDTLEILVLDAELVAEDPTALADSADAAVSSFTATVEGGISTSFDGVVRPMGGIYVGSLGDDGCSLQLSAWDPSNHAFAYFVVHSRHLLGRGIVRYSEPSTFYLGFASNEGNWWAHGSSMARKLPTVGFRERLDSIIAGRGEAGNAPELTAADREDIADRVGYDLFSDRPEERDVMGPGRYLVEDEARIYTADAGQLRLDVRPEDDRAVGTFAVSLEAELEDEGGNTYPDRVWLEGSFVLDLRSARTQGLVDIGRCTETPPLQIVDVSPNHDASGLDRFGTEPRIQFDRALDPRTVDTDAIQLGYRDRGGRFRPVSGRVVLYDDDSEVAFLPDDPLRDGIVYQVRVKTGEDGVRDLVGTPLEAGGTAVLEAGDDLYWWFSTAVDLSEAPNYVTASVYQSVLSPLLIPEKPASIRVRAHWEPDPAVHPADQVERFDARIRVLEPEGDQPTIEYEFIRPDLYDEYGVDLETAEHLAAFDHWLPSPRPGKELEAVDARWIRVDIPEVDPQAGTTDFWAGTSHLTAAVLDFWAIPSAGIYGQPVLDVDYYFLDAGEWNGVVDFRGLEPEDEGTLAEILTWFVESLSEEMLPVSNIETNLRGRASLKDRTSDPELLSALEERFGSDDLEMYEAAELLARHVDGTEAAVVVGFVPMSLYPAVRAVRTMSRDAPGIVIAGFSGALDRARPLDAPAGDDTVLPGDSPVEYWMAQLTRGLAEAMGLPVLGRSGDVSPSSEEAGASYGGIEGLRLDRQAGTASQKSARLGNAESDRLVPLMTYGLAHWQDTWIATHHYRRLQRIIEETGRW